MAHTADRLQRYLAGELGECRDVDVDRRLEELDSLATTLEESQLAAELDVLSALANETRYRLMNTLVAAHGEELCVCELQAVVEVSDSGLSHALSTLADADLVEAHKDGRWKKYRATNRAVALLTVLSGSVRPDE